MAPHDPMINFDEVIDLDWVCTLVWSERTALTFFGNSVWYFSVPSQISWAPAQGDSAKRKKMKMKKGAITLAVCASWLLTNAALAGEINGQGDPVPGGENGRSICSFSGLEDHDFEEPVDPGETQNWGSIPKIVRDFLATLGLHPGDSCSPGKPSDD